MATMEEWRRFYAEEIRFVADVTTPGLAEAYARVPRENFLGPGPWTIVSAEQRAMSIAGLTTAKSRTTSEARDLYHNVVVEIDAARNINNGQPSALGRWIDALQLKRGERALHVGCGVGYYTAIIAETVGPSGSVTGVEYESDLAARAKKNLAGYANVTVREGDGAAIDPGECDAMLINAGVTHPHAMWLDRLREGGRLVLPLTIQAGKTAHGQGVMTRITRRDGGYAAEFVSAVAIYSCASVRDPELEPLLLKALTTGALLRLKSVRRDEHEAAETCVVHGRGVCLSAAELSKEQTAP